MSRKNRSISFDSSKQEGNKEVKSEYNRLWRQRGAASKQPKSNYRDAARGKTLIFGNRWTNLFLGLFCHLAIGAILFMFIEPFLQSSSEVNYTTILATVIGVLALFTFKKSIIKVGVGYFAVPSLFGEESDDVLYEGLWWLPPYIYSYKIIDTKEVVSLTGEIEDLITLDNVKIGIEDVKINWYAVGRKAAWVENDEVIEDDIVSTTIAVIRQKIRNYTCEELLVSGKTLSEQIVSSDELTQTASRFDIEVSSVALTQINLPSKYTKAMIQGKIENEKIKSEKIKLDGSLQRFHDLVKEFEELGLSTSEALDKAADFYHLDKETADQIYWGGR